MRDGRAIDDGFDVQSGALQTAQRLLASRPEALHEDVRAETVPPRRKPNPLERTSTYGTPENVRSPDPPPPGGW